MPDVPIRGCRYHYVDEGAGPETIVFGHGYLMTHRMWREQIRALAPRYRCLAFDWRGQGQSEVTRGGYAIPDLARDAAAFIRAVAGGPVHYVGLSMGGFVGFHLGAEHADVVRSLTLLDTRAAPEPLANRLRYYAMLVTARTLGYGAVIDRVLPLMFGATSMREREALVREWTPVIESNPLPGVFRSGFGVFGRPDVGPSLATVTVPTLLGAGAEDTVTPPVCVERAAAAIPGSRLVTFPAAGHSSPLEAPEAVTAAITAFLADLTPAPA